MKKYTKTEKDRLVVFDILNEQVCNTYSEQTTYGNIYNSYVEFLMSNKILCKMVKENDINLKMIKSGLDNTFDKSITYIKKEK